MTPKPTEQLRKFPGKRLISRTMAAVCSLTLAVAGLVIPVYAAEQQPAATDTHTTANTPTLHTWWHDVAEQNGTTPIHDEAVRESPYYSTQVSDAQQPQTSYDSFTYISLPRNGNGKLGYTEQDGAEFSSAANLSMSWSSFEYSADAQVDVSLNTGQTISSVNDVTIRPTSDNFKKTLINDHTVRISVPYSDAGYRFSVEFAPQLITSYNDAKSGTGTLTTSPESGLAVSTEPQNAMLIFAQPMLNAQRSANEIPDQHAANVYQVQTGLVNNLDDIENADTLYFGPGTYWMGSKYRAQLPANIKWVYLAPGAYVKGAFKFLANSGNFKVTGYGVLSGEQYVYEADTENGYNHLDPNKSDCHSSCVKMLQFESSGTPQTLDLQGITVASPPYHTFVMYGDEDGPFAMNVNNYQQIGGWYWQTDGLELYKGSRLTNSFFHSNDDVIKLYHSNVNVSNNVIWKNENGPVFQWGWGPRTIDGVNVQDTDIIHNRMYWGDQKFNTCVFNSASSYLDMGATNTADPNQTIQNMTFTNTNVEGMVNCAMRIFTMSNTKKITIDGLHIDSWNKLNSTAQENLFRKLTNSAGTPVTVGNQTQDKDGLLIHNYTVGGTPILKAGDNWASGELGRMNFDANLWDNWDATADNSPQGDKPTLTISGLQDGQTVDKRNITVSGRTNATSVRIAVNDGEETVVPVTDGTFNATINVPQVSNNIRVAAIGANQVMNVARFNVYAYGTLLGSLDDPAGDDNGPGSYVYPSDGAFNPGSFDLRKFAVYQDGDTVRFVTSVNSPISNPWGGNGMSTQRLNIYIANKAQSTAKKTSGATPLLPGTNTFGQQPWDKVVVVDGRNNNSPLGPGVYSPGETPQKEGPIDLNVIQGSVIVASVAAKNLQGLDLSKAGYQVSMYSSAEDSEGIGNVRPVFSKACWSGEGCPSFAHQYRFGGGLGVPTDSGAHDSITTDSNAIDINSGPYSQAKLMDLHNTQVVLPFVPLQSAQPNQPDNHDNSGNTTPINGTSPSNASGSAQTSLPDTGTAVSVLALLTLLFGSAAFAVRKLRKLPSSSPRK